MDVSGRKPTSETGSYFRNNVWWWHPLWNYCCDVAPEICNKVEHAHSNDGDGLGKRDSLRLAKILKEELSSGRTKEYEQEHKKRLDAIPDEVCEHCKGTGERLVQQDGVPVPFEAVIEDLKKLGCKVQVVGDIKNLKIPPEFVPNEGTESLLKLNMVECNACHGKGKVRPWSTNYPFSEENVKEWAAFLQDCGGFNIC